MVDSSLRLKKTDFQTLKMVETSPGIFEPMELESKQEANIPTNIKSLQSLVINYRAQLTHWKKYCEGLLAQNTELKIKAGMTGAREKVFEDDFEKIHALQQELDSMRVKHNTHKKGC